MNENYRSVDLKKMRFKEISRKFSKEKEKSIYHHHHIIIIIHFFLATQESRIKNPKKQTSSSSSKSDFWSQKKKWIEIEIHFSDDCNIDIQSLYLKRKCWMNVQAKKKFRFKSVQKMKKKEKRWSMCVCWMILVVKLSMLFVVSVMYTCLTIMWCDVMCYNDEWWSSSSSFRLNDNHDVFVQFFFSFLRFYKLIMDFSYPFFFSSFLFLTTFFLNSNWPITEQNFLKKVFVFAFIVDHNHHYVFLGKISGLIDLTRKLFFSGKIFFFKKVTSFFLHWKQ